MVLVSQARCGISAKRLERELGVPLKDRSADADLIRNQLMDDQDGEPLSGDVEVDETYHGASLAPRPCATRRATSTSLGGPWCSAWSSVEARSALPTCRTLAGPR